MVIEPQEERTREEWKKKDLRRQTQNRASFMSQWYLIHLPVQETQVRSLVQEDPTCVGTTKPMRRNHWPCALEPGSQNCWARAPAAQELPLCPNLCNPRRCSQPASLCMGFFRLRHWSGLPFPPLGGSSWPRDWICILCVPCTAGGFFTAEPLGSSCTTTSEALAP